MKSPQLTSKLTGKTESFPSKIWYKERMPTLTISFQHGTENPSQRTVTRKKKIKRHLNWKKRNKIIYICRGHDHIQENPKDFTKNCWNVRTNKQIQ